MILWIALLACFTLKENRNLRAFLIIVPIVVVAAILGMLCQLTGSSSNIFTQAVYALMIGASMLLLLLDRLRMYKPAAIYIISLVLLSIIGVVSMFAFGGINLSQENIWIFIFQFIWAASLLFGILITRYFCRKTLSGTSFSLWLLLWMTIVFDITMFLTTVASFAIEGHLLRNFLIFLIVVPIYGTILAILAYLCTLPYLILTFKSDFYRKRVLACLRLDEFVKREGLMQADMSEKY
jgi:hypothetical protein